MMGIGANLYYLSGGSPKDPEKYYGKKILKAKQVGDEFHVDFHDGVKIKIWDDGQSCCEDRHMTCDDDLTILENAVLKEIRVKTVDKEHEYGDHEIAFLEVRADQGSIQFATHNIHNGYYGGFGISLDERISDKASGTEE